MDTCFREGSSALGLQYVVGLLSTTSLWRPGQGPLPAKARRRTGCPPKRLRHSPDHCPVSVRELVVEMGEKALRRVSRREGIKQQVAIAFCGGAGATRPSGLRARGAAPGAVAAGRMAAQGSRADQVLALEPAAADRAQGAGAVGQAPLDRGAGLFGAPAGVGAGHFEGRSWRGFPHHATLCTAAYGFPVAERSRFPPRRAPEDSAWQESGSQPTNAYGAARRLGRHFEAASIAGIRSASTAWLIRQLPCCPFCGVRRLRPSSISAKGSSGTDGDALDCRWIYYPEPGTYASSRLLAIEGAEACEAAFVAPKVNKPGTIHIVLAVTDRGSPPLTRYQRVIVTVYP